MASHDVDYQVFGDDMQFVEVELDPGETVVAEAGMMMYIEQDISFTTKLGDGSEPDQGIGSKLFSAGKRMLTGESLFMTHFTNDGAGKRKVAFAAPYPGKIIPLDLDDIGGRIICQRDSFLAAAMGTKISIAFQKKLGAGFFGGEGFILQDLQGDGMVFIHAGGTIVEKQLNNETLRIDTGCLVAFQPSLSYDIEKAGSISSMAFGGEGLFFATMSGTGKVWIQSLPFSRLADRVLAAAPAVGSSNVGETSGAFGALGKLIN